MKQSRWLFTFVACLGLASSLRAQLIVLPSTWGEWDYKQYLYGGVGNLVVSNQSSTGFTAWVATNDVDAINNANLAKVPDGTNEVAGRPAIFQEFPALDLSQVGQKIKATFDLKFNNPLVWSDQFVRFGFGNTNNNSAFYLKIDSGLGGGDTLGFRSDATTTDTNGQSLISATFDPNGNLATATNLNVPPNVGPSGGFVSGNYSHFLNSGGLNPPGSAYPANINGAYPNGVGLGVADTLDIIHTISLSMERVTANGLKIVGTWSNSAGPALLVSGYNAPYLDTPLPAGHGRLDQVGCLGFYFQSNDLFTNGYAGGTYTVSNFRLDYTTFRITQVIKDPTGDGLTLTWVSKPNESYTIEYTDGSFTHNWTTEQTGIASQGETTTITIFSSPGLFYRIRKE